MFFLTQSSHQVKFTLKGMTIYITILEEDGLYRHINVLLYCYVIKICGLTSISLLLTQIMMNQLFLLVVRDAYRFPCNTLTTEQVLSYMEGGGGATWICSTAGLVSDRPTCYSQSHTTDVKGCSQIEDSH